MNKNKNAGSLLGHLLACVLLVSITHGCSLQNHQLAKTEIKKTYYPSGKLKSVSSYKNGKKDGEGKEYNEQGICIEENNYEKGELKSKSLFYDYELRQRLGTLQRIDFYKNGKPYRGHNYNLDGELESTAVWKDPHTTIIQTLSNGVVISEENVDPLAMDVYSYELDKQKQGIQKYYYPTGELHYVDIYRHGEKVNRKAYDIEGKLLVTA